MGRTHPSKQEGEKPQLQLRSSPDPAVDTTSLATDQRITGHFLCGMNGRRAVTEGVRMGGGGRPAADAGVGQRPALPAASLTALPCSSCLDPPHICLVTAQTLQTSPDHGHPSSLTLPCLSQGLSRPLSQLEWDFSSPLRPQGPSRPHTRRSSTAQGHFPFLLLSVFLAIPKEEALFSESVVCTVTRPLTYTISAVIQSS